MTEPLPPPMVPPEVDLRAFRYMPVHVATLRQSKAWAIARRTPALGFYMFNLWAAAWHETPAGSLEDDDVTLCDLAMCDPRKWPQVRDKVLRGWTKCSDGRLYHDFVADVVLASWNERQEKAKRTEAARLARKSKANGNVTETVTEDGTRSATTDVTMNVTRPVTSAVTASNGREGKGIEGNPPIVPHDNPEPMRPSDAAAGLASDFLRLRRQHWSDESALPAPTLTLQTEARQFLDQGGTAEIILATIERGMARMVETGKRAPTSLRAFHRSIADAIASASPEETGRALKSAEDVIASVLSDEDWRTWLRAFTGPEEKWPASVLGPKPGEPGCKCPQRLIDELVGISAPQPPAVPAPQVPPPTPEAPPGLSDDDWRVWVKGFVQAGQWPGFLGPKPWTDGNRTPGHVLAEFETQRRVG